MNEPSSGGVREPKSKEPMVKQVSDLQIGTDTFVKERDFKITKIYDIDPVPMGTGAFGEVRKAKHHTSGEWRAIKVITKDLQSPEEKERLLNEVAIMRKLDHPNIIKVMEYFQDEKYFYIVTELCTGGELFDRIIEADRHRFSEIKAATIMLQVLSAVSFCHANNIVHRDLKPENLLLSAKSLESTLKVIDFGLSKNFDPNSKMKHKMGTIFYMAPEVLKGLYDEKCDIWSCGVIAYILLSGSPPFKGPNDEATHRLIEGAKLNFETKVWKGISDDAKKFLSKMICKDPAQRYSAAEALKDPWLVQNANKAELANTEANTEALGSLKSFHCDRKLAQATNVFMVNYLTSQNERANLETLFRSLDKNNDGTLTRAELIEGYKTLYKMTDPEDEVDRLMQEVDSNKSGKVEYSEFLTAAMNKSNLLSKKKLEEAFNLFDHDGNGEITAEELKTILEPTKKAAPQVWEDIIKEVDQNGDGKISLKEFKEMMFRSTIPPQK